MAGPDTTAVRIDKDLAAEVDFAAARLGMTREAYVGTVLRSVAGAEFNRSIGRPPEVLTKEQTACIVTLVSKRTGETFEACFQRVMSRAFLLEFAVQCGSGG